MGLIYVPVGRVCKPKEGRKKFDISDEISNFDSQKKEKENVHVSVTKCMRLVHLLADLNYSV